jgi:hypothetical protein
VIDDRDAVARAWILPPSGPPIEDGLLDGLAALQTTNPVICNVRSCIVTLPDWDSHSHHSAPKQEYRSKVAARNAGRRVLLVAAPLGGYPFPEDKLGQVGKAALEVLATPRKLEERARFLFIDDAYDAYSEQGLSGQLDPGKGVLSSHGSG